MRLPFESGAVDELETAAVWYERERPGYGAVFMSEVRRNVDRASRLPQSGIRVLGIEPEHDVRRFQLRRFPYSVVTALFDGSRVVVAVAHGSREPGYWRDRLK